MKQHFGSALSRPWALVKWGGNQPNGRRPSTTVAYLTDPIKDEDDNIIAYEGGLVEFYRIRTRVRRLPDGTIKTIPGEPIAQWHFRFKNPTTIAAEDVCEFFPNHKGRASGPTPNQIRGAKKRVPVNPSNEVAA